MTGQVSSISTKFEMRGQVSGISDKFEMRGQVSSISAITNLSSHLKLS
jgi:hypothetical protein